MYNAIDVANYIINKSIDINAPVSNLKLQKLLYYVQAAKLVKDGVPMFEDDISAWKYGPVVESVYHRFKIYANTQINEKVVCRGIDFLSDFLSNDEYDPCEFISTEDCIIIDKIIEAYKDHTAMQLVRKTHNEAPWKDAREKNEAYISTGAIKAYYKADESMLYN